MNSLTRFFLVLLRLAIGWHFFFEGLEKIQSVDQGPTETNRPWTSAAYLREATGPLGHFFRRQVGDLDEEALARLTPTPMQPDANPIDRFPPALGRDWDRYLQGYLTHYAPDAAERERAEAKLRACKERTIDWLLHSKRKVAATFPTGTVEVEKTIPERVEEFRQKVERLHQMQEKDLPAFGRDVRKEQLPTMKAEVSKVRAALLAELHSHTVEMEKDLGTLLTSAQRDKGPVPEALDQPAVAWIDAATRYGLLAVGACLLLGAFTRTACVAGAGFLLLFYLAMPPFPWVPENLHAEGHYLFVNKNLIEMLALICLATTHSGRWVGLDGLLQFLNPRRWRARSQAGVLQSR
jgi:uncharacterized membrane protein YphA (DoxX/SURF4 family)